MYRRQCDLYKNYSYAGPILIELCPTIGDLLRSLEVYLSVHEQLEVERWSGEWYYIVVVDNRFKNHPHEARCGFTVNIVRDIIMWNNTTDDNQFGGNCFLRSARWRAFVNKKWNNTVTDEMMHFYTHIYPKDDK